MKPLHRDRRRAPGAYVSSEQVQREAGISYRQLDYWCSLGYLHAAKDENNPGSGHARSFAASEADVARTMGQLVKAGITPREAHRVAREIAEQDRAHLGDFLITREPA